ncbi:MAG: FecR domain-containing protein [Kiritimatiellae bacterium]|nr:FecR domain-containing protein [Kiritimatiellia bacterium]
MNDDVFADRIGAFLEERGSEQAERELTTLLATRPALGAEARRQVAMDTLLHVLAGAMPVEEGLLDAVADRIEPDSAARAPRTAPRPARRPHAPTRFPQPWARVKRRHFGRRLLALAAAVLAVLGAVWYFRELPAWLHLQRGVHAVIAQVEGDVRLIRGPTTTAARLGQTVRPADRLLTSGEAGTASLRYADGTELQLAQDTDITVGDAETAFPVQAVFASACRVFLAAGAVEFDVTARPAEQRMVVSTCHSDIAVLGTRLRVSAAPASTQVDVDSGRVRVFCRRNGQSAELRAGQSAVVGATISIADRARFSASRSRAPLALYTFGAGRGVVVHDVSNSGEAVDLLIRNPGAVRWMPGGGLSVDAFTTIVSARPAAKISTACRSSAEFSVEAWVRPIDTVQGSQSGRWLARIVSLSGDTLNRNFTLGQWGDHYCARIRTSAANPNGEPDLLSKPGTVQTEWQHVVLTLSGDGRASLYVNGVDQSVFDPVPQELSGHAPSLRGGDLSDWDESFRLLLANESEADRNRRPWLGAFRAVAVYDRALSAAEIAENYRAGAPTASAGGQR